MNEKHLKILAEETGLLETTLAEANPKIYTSNALAAMQKLQEEIEKLTIENRQLKDTIVRNHDINILKPETKITITDFKLIELKNPQNPHSSNNPEKK